MLSTKEIQDKADQILSRNAHIKKCVDANICPDCGEELLDFGDEDHDIEMGCNKCGELYQMKKYLFFGSIVTKRKIKYWG